MPSVLPFLLGMNKSCEQRIKVSLTSKSKLNMSSIILPRIKKKIVCLGEIFLMVLPHLFNSTYYNCNVKEEAKISLYLLFCEVFK